MFLVDFNIICCVHVIFTIEKLLKLFVLFAYVHACVRASLFLETIKILDDIIYGAQRRSCPASWDNVYCFFFKDIE